MKKLILSMILTGLPIWCFCSDYFEDFNPNPNHICNKCYIIENRMLCEIERLCCIMYKKDQEGIKDNKYYYYKGRLDALEDLRIYYLTD